MVDPKSTDPADRASKLAAMVGLVVVGMAVALGVFIQIQEHVGPPEDVPRSIAIPALYATAGIVAIIASIRRRPLVVVGAGVVCLIGIILSVAAFPFAAPGLLLLAFGARVTPVAGSGRRDGVVAAAVVVLVVGAGVALLATTGGRCWQETGSAASPTYITTACDDGTGAQGQGQSVGGATSNGVEVIGSGYDGGVLTFTGAAIESALLLVALGLVTVTGGRGAGSTIPRRPSLWS